MELGSKWRREKERLLIVIVECGWEHFIWKEGWPQPGEEEKGKGRRVEVKGGHEFNGGEHV